MTSFETANEISSNIVAPLSVDKITIATLQL